MLNNKDPLLQMAGELANNLVQVKTQHRTKMKNLSRKFNEFEEELMEKNTEADLLKEL